MAIKNIKNRPKPTKIEIDLTGPDGNAFVLMSYARRLGKMLGHDENRIEKIIEEMMLTDYEGLLYTFDREFGAFVTLWR